MFFLRRGLTTAILRDLGNMPVGNEVLIIKRGEKIQ